MYRLMVPLSPVCPLMERVTMKQSIIFTIGNVFINIWMNIEVAKYHTYGGVVPLSMSV